MMPEPAEVVRFLQLGGGRVAVLTYDSCPQWSVPLGVVVGDPATGVWRVVGHLKGWPTAVALGDGRVLFAGGGLDGDDFDYWTGSTGVSRIWDPSTGAWSRTGSLLMSRAGATGVPLADGEALLAGGRWADLPRIRRLVSAERWEPTTGRWSKSSSPSDSLTVLSDGAVLALGGYSTDKGGNTSAAVAILKPGAAAWQRIADLPDPFARRIVAMPGGGALAIRLDTSLADDTGAVAASDAVYRLDREAGSWSAAPELLDLIRAGSLVVPLGDGRIVAVGGPSIAAYDPGRGLWRAAEGVSGSDRAALALADGSVLLGNWGRGCIGDEEDTLAQPLSRFIPDD